MPLPLDYHQQVYALAQQYGIQVHIDGARVFNAARALKIKAADIAQASDSILFVFRKVWCAPIGSVLCGSRAFIDEAKRIRKQLGGGMRQVGVIAAAGIVALEKMTERLEEDHQRAKTLAEGLSSLKGITFPMGMPTTNMVFIELVKSLP
jgi:threonine aldolase